MFIWIGIGIAWFGHMLIKVLRRWDCKDVGKGTETMIYTCNPYKNLSEYMPNLSLYWNMKYNELFAAGILTLLKSSSLHQRNFKHFKVKIGWVFIILSVMWILLIPIPLLFNNTHLTILKMI